jgi:manganese-dependent ADP-ribose/CDP-alcohol diphosphatase
MHTHCEQCYDISAEGWDPEHPKSLYARSILEKINPNRNQNSPAGLDGLNQRFVRFGGAVGPRQLLWLKMQLEEAGNEK